MSPSHSASPSFAIDALRAIGSALDDAQTSPSLHASSGEQDELATQVELGVDLDLSQIQRLPDRTALLEALDQLGATSAILAPSNGAGSRRNDPREQALARIAYLSHALLLDTLLKEAQLLGDQEWYWSEIEDELRRTATYLIQSEGRHPHSFM